MSSEEIKESAFPSNLGTDVKELERIYKNWDHFGKMFSKFCRNYNGNKDDLKKLFPNYDALSSEMISKLEPFFTGIPEEMETLEEIVVVKSRITRQTTPEIEEPNGIWRLG